MIKAVRYASERGAHLVNMSLNYTRSPVVDADITALQDAIVQYLTSRNVIVIGAMGNFGQTDRNESPFPPANFDSVIAVGGTNYQLTDGDGVPIDNPQERLSVISNRGPWMSVTAPGQNVRVLTGHETSGCGTKDE